MGQGSRLIRPRTVTGDGDGLVSHAGVGWLAEVADLSGLTAGLSAAMAAVPQRRHDPGRTLTQMILGLVDGATCLSDASAQPRVAGSDPCGQRCAFRLNGAGRAEQAQRVVDRPRHPGGRSGGPADPSSGR